MTTSLEQLQQLLETKEGKGLEFKEAKHDFHFDKLAKYCAALANGLGGQLVLGVTDKFPRKVVGTSAFRNSESTASDVAKRLCLLIEVEEVTHPHGRVLIFHVPARPRGLAIEYKGTYWVRRDEEVVAMPAEMLRKIFNETPPDFSAEVCPAATFSDLAPEAIAVFRKMWRTKSDNRHLEDIPDQQLLADAELLMDGRVTYAALVLFGTHQALGRHLAQCEIIFEYRSDSAAIDYQQRKEFRQGFFLCVDDLWMNVNLRNDVQHIQDGLFRWDVPTFRESVVREAILNAVSHRDYRLPGSIFIRQAPRELEIVSPGGLPSGITTRNILWHQSPRNRRIAEALARCGLVERSGQGMNRMFEESIKEGKPTPDFSDTDEYQVAVKLRGEVQDPQFVEFLNQVNAENLVSFHLADLLVLDLVRQEKPVPEEWRKRLPHLLENGVLETIGRGRGVRYILSRRFYRFLGKQGVYTRKKGLDRETHKALLLKHIRDNREEGSRLEDLMQVLPSLSRSQVQTLLRALRSEGSILHAGHTHRARWYPAPAENQTGGK